MARFLVADMARIAGAVHVAVVPPLCPLETSSYDFSRTRELIDRAEGATLDWLDAGGLDAGGIPLQLHPHGH